MPDNEVVIRPLGNAGDLGWVVMAHGEQYAREFGWDATFEALVARIVADFAGTEDPRQAAWMAEVAGERVGCVFCVPKDHQTAQLRILLVTPPGRCRGLGRRLVDGCVAFARNAGYQSIVLWTNDSLAAAPKIYLDAGFWLVEEERHHSFGVDLIGQYYRLGLTGNAAPDQTQTVAAVGVTQARGRPSV